MLNEKKMAYMARDIGDKMNEATSLYKEKVEKQCNSGHLRGEGGGGVGRLGQEKH